MTKNTIVSIIIAFTLIILAIIFTSNKGGAQKQNIEDNPIVNNVSIIDGKQIIEIRAKGGYTPRVSIAKADTPTILRFNTNGTFDCSSSVRIPSMGISKFLPQSGTTDIDLGINKIGTLQGTCGMGMYPFEIEFQ